MLLPLPYTEKFNSFIFFFYCTVTIILSDITQCGLYDVADVVVGDNSLTGGGLSGGQVSL